MIIGKNKNIINIITICLSLAKVSQSSLITLSTLFTYIIKTPELNTLLLITGVGLFLLTCGSATLNNYQDKHIDLKIRRTQNRPLAAGRINPRFALFQAIGLIVLGLTVLYLADMSFKLFFWGFLGVIIYNFIYTPLKTKTLLAIIPGSICGMIPPIIGWISAGGELFSIGLLVIITIFGVWQVPHYWTILFQYSDDYQSTDLTNILRFFDPPQVKKIMFIWVFSFSLISLLLPYVQIIHTNIASLFLLINALGLVTIFFYQLLIKPNPGNYRLLSIHLNASLAFIMLLSTLERLV